MRKTKMIIALIIVFSLVMSISMGVFANTENSTKAERDAAIKQESAINDYNYLMNEKFKGNLPDEYSGSYIDESGNLVVNVNNENPKFLKNDSKLHKVILKRVKYSFNHLKKLNDDIVPNMIIEGISAMEIDEINNCIVLHINEKERDNFEKFKDKYKGQEFKVIYTNTHVETTATPTTINVVNGSKVSLGSAGDFTIGFGAKDNSTGKLGFVVPGHAISVGSIAQYNGTTFGDCTKSIFNTSGVDAAFIERRAPTSLSN